MAKTKKAKTAKPAAGPVYQQMVWPNGSKSLGYIAPGGGRVSKDSLILGTCHIGPGVSIYGESVVSESHIGGDCVEIRGASISNCELKNCDNLFIAGGAVRYDGQVHHGVTLSQCKMYDSLDMQIHQHIDLNERRRFEFQETRMCDCVVTDCKDIVVQGGSTLHDVSVDDSTAVEFGSKLAANQLQVRRCERVSLDGHGTLAGGNEKLELKYLRNIVFLSEFPFAEFTGCDGLMTPSSMPLPAWLHMSRPPVYLTVETGKVLVADNMLQWSSRHKGRTLRCTFAAWLDWRDDKFNATYAEDDDFCRVRAKYRQIVANLIKLNK